MEQLPKRKPNRLPNYDYTLPGPYFITICTAQMRCLFGSVIPGDEKELSRMARSEAGELAARTLQEIPLHYPGVCVEKYVIMPNHVHLILTIPDLAEKQANLSVIIGQYKRAVSMRIGSKVWQTHYYDHIIRNKEEFQRIWEYIDNNPQRWALDRYFTD